MDDLADDLIGKHLRAMAAEGMTAQQAAKELGMGYNALWRRAARRGIVFACNDGREKRKATWAAKKAALAAVELPDDEWKPVNLSGKAISALYRGRRYDRPETWAP